MAEGRSLDSGGLTAAAFGNEAKLKESSQVFTHITTHNAYHIGQIIYVRKEQGSWDPNNGVTIAPLCVALSHEWNPRRRDQAITVHCPG